MMMASILNSVILINIISYYQYIEQWIGAGLNCNFIDSNCPAEDLLRIYMPCRVKQKFTQV